MSAPWYSCMTGAGQCDNCRNLDLSAPWPTIKPLSAEAIKEMAESMADGYLGRREHDGPCDIERVEPGWNVQTDSGEVFVSDAEIAELRDKLEGGDIQAARLIAERYSAAYADGFAAGVELGESRAAAAAPVAAAAPDLAPGVEFALEVMRKDYDPWTDGLAHHVRLSNLILAKLAGVVEP